jgi:hypothetical protein
MSQAVRKELITIVLRGMFLSRFASEQGRIRDMRKCAIASMLMFTLATSALAAGAKYYVEMDTVGNCSVVDSKPSASSGMKIMGDKGGYASKEDAGKALKGLKCKGIVG